MCNLEFLGNGKISSHILPFFIMDNNNKFFKFKKQFSNYPTSTNPYQTFSKFSILIYVYSPKILTNDRDF